MTLNTLAGKDNQIADGFSRLRSDNKSTTNKKSNLVVVHVKHDAQDTTSLKGEVGDNPDIDADGLIDLLDVLDITDSPSVPKHFLYLKTGYIEEHFDFFALDVMRYESMSDNQIRIYTIEVHNDVAGQFQV